MRTKIKRPRQCVDCPFIVGQKSELLGGVDALAFPGSKTSELWDCHDTATNRFQVDLPCIGWLNNQAKEGHNQHLNAQLVNCANLHEVSPRGEQLEMFEVLVVGNERRDESDRPYRPKSQAEAYALIKECHGLAFDEELLREYREHLKSGLLLEGAG
jgi:hypothetical protein